MDERLRRDVAIKVLPEGTLDDEASRRRFHQEALTLSKLNHPHIATIYDFHSQDGTDYLVMEYIAGPTLDELLRDGPLSEQDVARLGAQIVDALAEAHEHGIVHRDLKPGNIIVTTRGQVKVLDFGLAKLLEPLNVVGDDAPTVERTEKGIARGTLPYMSPEQLLGQSVGPASDIYAAGAVLYEMATGQRPYPGLQGPALIDAILHKEPISPCSVRATVPAELERIIVRALKKDPAKRPQSTGELTEALRRISLSMSAPTLTGKRRVATTLWVGAAGLALAGLLAWVWTWNRDAPPEAATVLEAPSAAPVVAVLPFENSSGDATIDYLGVGIAHSLIASLSAVPAITVVSPSSTLAYEGGRSAPEEVARDLGATHVVTGSIQKAGARLRLTANLVRADHSVAWGGASEGTLDELFSLQNELSRGLGEALEPAFTKSAPRLEATPPTENSEAFADYTQALAFLERPDVPGNIERSIQLFESAIEKDTSFAAAHAGLGDAYWNQYRRTGDVSWTERARDATMEALRLDPDDARVRYALAVIYADTGRADEAIEELHRSLEILPNNDDAHRLLADIFFSRGDRQRAIAEFENAIRIRPNFWGNYRALGIAYFRAGEYEKAAAALTRVTELQPDLPWGFQTLGAIYHTAGDVDRAVENYERAIELGPSAAAYSNLGTIHYRQGDFDEAVRLYQASLELQSKPITYRNLGDAYQRLGERVKAREAFSQAKALAVARLDVNPKDAATLGALAVYEAKLGESRAAMKHAHDAVALAPTDPDVLYRRAVVHALTGEAPDATGYLEQALERGYSLSEAVLDDDLETLRATEAYRALLENYRWKESK